MTATAEETKTLTMVVLRSDYPVAYRPLATRYENFWSSSNTDDRTFFSVEVAGSPTLVVHADDPRSGGMRRLTYGREPEIVREAGLDPLLHLVWTMEERHIESKAKATDADTDTSWLYVTDQHFYASADETHYRLFVGETGMSSWAIQDRTYTEGHPLRQAFALGFTHAWACTPRESEGTLRRWDEEVGKTPEDDIKVGDIVEIVNHTAAWDGEAEVVRMSSALDEHRIYVVRKPGSDGEGGFTRQYIKTKPQKPQVPYAPGDDVLDDFLRANRGVLFRRFGSTDQLWVTHGDGTATQIVGDPHSNAPRRMGVGNRHPKFEPDNSWVAGGWTFDSVDESRVPEDKPDSRIGRWFSWGSKNTWYRIAEFLPSGFVKADRRYEEGDDDDCESTREFNLDSLEGLVIPDPGHDSLPEVIRGEADPEQVAAPASEQVDPKDAEITRLRDLLTKAEKAHADDIEKIGDRLVQECEHRGWCEEFDGIVDEINDGLSIALPNMLRERDYEVTLDVTFRITKYVSATDEDNAESRAMESWDMSDINDSSHHDTEANRTRLV